MSGLRVCGRHGCAELTEDAYCPAHVPPRVQGRRWVRLRAAKLREDPVCEICGREVAAEVDHIKEIQDGGHPLDWDNLQSLCTRCHRDKTTARRQA